MVENKFVKTNDGSVLDSSGKVLYFSCERFVRDIAEGNCCFICGADKATTKFNDEHVIPDWVLKRFRLHSRTITLPNDTEFSYGRYKIPCCERCNSLLGSTFETPISALFAKGADSICEYIKEHGSTLIYLWMGMIYFKMHLRDRHFRIEPDLRVESEQISGLYDWKDLHHLHCVLRSFYTGASMTPGVLGSFIVMPFLTDGSLEPFDYGDVYSAQSMFIRLDDIILYAVFNDACGALNGMMPRIERICGPLNELQAREILAELAFLNYHIAKRPYFRSSFAEPNGEYTIIAHVPDDFQLRDLDMELRGIFLHQVLKSIIGENFELRGMRGEEAAELVKRGDITFLFDDNGKFILGGRSLRDGNA